MAGIKETKKEKKLIKGLSPEELIKYKASRHETNPRVANNKFIKNVRKANIALLDDSVASAYLQCKLIRIEADYSRVIIIFSNDGQTIKYCYMTHDSDKKQILQILKLITTNTTAELEDKILDCVYNLRTTGGNSAVSEFFEFEKPVGAILPSTVSEEDTSEDDENEDEDEDDDIIEEVREAMARLASGEKFDDFDDEEPSGEKVNLWSQV